MKSDAACQIPAATSSNSQLTFPSQDTRSQEERNGYFSHMPNHMMWKQVVIQGLTMKIVYKWNFIIVQ